MHHDQKLEEKLITYLQDAYAMENQIVETLEKQVAQTEKVPHVQLRVKEHLEATRQHRARMEQRLNAYGKQPSPVKGAMSTVMGNTMGILGGARPDSLAMTSRDDYTVEHFEIGTYAMLITVAKAFGDEETVRACQMNVQDEVRMQQWLAQHAAEATLLSLQQDGIEIPDSAWQWSKQAESLAHPVEALAGAATGI
jgi:ferritin-like metal-binding protein YciE